VWRRACSAPGYWCKAECSSATANWCADWGHFEQIGPLLRCGPAAGGGPQLMLPGIGEHTVEVLTQLGVSGEEIDTLLAAKVARQLED
jgi:crotonobetainyl-CoA:carnitine CoA-transferase CaiB-like acyl-CoA transferase